MPAVIGQNYNSYYKGTEDIRNYNSYNVEKKEKEMIPVPQDSSVELSISKEGYERLLNIKNNDPDASNMSYEEKAAYLQQSLKKATELYKIEPGIDLRSKYGYVSTGELMKEKDPEFYERHNKMVTEAMEKGDQKQLLEAIREMLRWQSEYDKGNPYSYNYSRLFD